MFRCPKFTLAFAVLFTAGLLQSGYIDPAMLKSQNKEQDETAEATPAPQPAPAQRPVGNHPAGGSVIGQALIAPDMDARPAVQNNPAPAAAPAQPPRPSFPKNNSEIYDKKKLMAENPNLIEVENKIRASDPLTAASQSYFAIGSRAQVLNMKHDLDLYHAEHGRWPTFDEFKQRLQQYNVELSGVYRWQVYAYDETDGTISILENREMKKQIYENAGIPVD